MESSAAVPGFGKIRSWLNSSDRDWDLSLNTPFFGFYQALNPHFFTLAEQIKDTWPFLTFHSIHPGKKKTKHENAEGFWVFWDTPRWLNVLS